MEKVKVSLVSYLNSRPFAYGLHHSDIYKYISLSLDHPALCAEKLIGKKVDAGLVPVAVIPDIATAVIISDYCIAATGKVQSVLLVSNVPINDIKSVILDQESRTSVLLARVLAKEFWMVDPVWIAESGDNFQETGGTCAAVVIGDRALKMRSQFKYIYDLSEEWQKMTGLPFVFACWVANKSLGNTFLAAFNEALKFGVEHIDELVLSEELSVNDRNYLVNSIQYQLDDNKRKGLELFLKLIRQFN